MTNVRRGVVPLGLEVLRLRAQGLSNAEIARSMHISENTVKARLTRLYKAIGALDATHAVVIAAIDGLLTKDDLRAAYAERRPAVREEKE